MLFSNATSISVTIHSYHDHGNCVPSITQASRLLLILPHLVVIIVFLTQCLFLACLGMLHPIDTLVFYVTVVLLYSYWGLHQQWLHNKGFFCYIPSIALAIYLCEMVHYFIEFVSCL